MSLLKLQVEAVRCRLDGIIYAMKSMMKAAVRRAGQVGDQPVRPLTLVIVPRHRKANSRDRLGLQRPCPVTTGRLPKPRECSSRHPICSLRVALGSNLRQSVGIRSRITRRIRRVAVVGGADGELH
jgi:hypothetical protein